MLLRPTSHVRTGIGMQETLSRQAGHAASHGVLFVHRLHNFLLVAGVCDGHDPSLVLACSSQPYGPCDLSVVAFSNVVVQWWC